MIEPLDGDYNVQLSTVEPTEYTAYFFGYDEEYTPSTAILTGDLGADSTQTYLVDYSSTTGLEMTGSQICSTLGDNPHKLIRDRDIFKFSGEEGEEVVVRLEADYDGFSEGERATLILKDRIRRVWLFKIDRSALPNTITSTLPATGQYRVVVAEQSRFAHGEKFIGDYCLSLESSQDAWQTLEPTRWVE